MPESANRVLRIGACALVFLGYAGLGATARYGPAILLVPVIAIALMPLGEWLDARSGRYRALSGAMSLALVVALPVVFNVINLLDGVTFLVIYIQVYTLLHTKKVRNYNHLILMSFFLLLAASVMTPTPVIGAVFLLFIVVATVKLAALEMMASSTLAGDGRVDVVDLDVHEAPIDNSPGRLIDVRLAATTGMACAVVVASTAGIFFFTPRMEAGLFGAQDAEFARTGLSTQINLGEGGLIELDRRAVMRVVFPGLPGGRFPGELYWRTTALDRYTGSGWAHTGINTRRPDISPRDRILYRKFAAFDVSEKGGSIDRVAIGRGDQIEQDIFLVENPTTGLPALTLVKAVEPGEDQKDIRVWWDKASDFTAVVGRRSNSGGLSYRAWSEVEEPSPDELRTSTGDYLELIKDGNYNHLTRQNLLPKTAELVRQITGDAATRYDKIVAIENYITSADYVYTLDVPPLPAENAIDVFVNDVKKGHCELFASAMVLMIRSIGIPSRLAQGYRGGSFDAADRSYMVSADMAHLWVEVLFPEFGWVTFDPSPQRSEADELGLTGIQRSLSRMALRGRMLWYRNVVGFSPRDRLKIMEDFTISLFRMERDPREGQANEKEGVALLGRFGGLLAPMALVSVLLFTIFSIWRLAVRVRAPRLVLTKSQSRATRTHKLLVAKLRHLGVDPRGKSVEEIRVELSRVPLANRDDTLTILGAYNAARFGGRTLDSRGYGVLRGLIAGLRLRKTAQ